MRWVKAEVYTPDKRLGLPWLRDGVGGTSCAALVGIYQGNVQRIIQGLVGQGVGRGE